jgi:cytochrome P450
MEMRIVLARILERAQLRAVDTSTAKAQFRAITLSPQGGVRVVQERAPAPATVADAPVPVA